uniref:EGF-like domain-containing protein n=1 Tax=Steinernema glaseri TaxID=37863 RepID=A0A1I7YNF7_9BILA
MTIFKVLLTFIVLNSGVAAYRQRQRCPVISTADNTLSKTCECEADWNAGVCAATREDPLETVCVCRTQHSDQGQCSQHVTKCYHNSTASSGYVWHLQFPPNVVQLFMLLPARASVLSPARISVQGQVCAYTGDSGGQNEPSEVPFVIFRVCGVAFTYIHLVIIISGIFLTILLITCFLLCFTRYQIDKQRGEKMERRAKARQSLLIQKEDEDKYLA